MHKTNILLSIPIVLGLLLAGCETTDVLMVSPKEFQDSLPMGGTTGTAVLASGDMLSLSVEVDGRMEVPQYQAVVNNLGFVTLPLVGDVQVAGMGINIARTLIAKRYGSYYVSNPVIMLTLVNENSSSEWGQVSVLGRVKNPGPVPLPSGSGIRLSAAIQAAGGFSPSAKTTEIQVTRIDKRGRKLRVVINFNDIGASGNADADLRLMAGDIVNIPERIW